MPQAGPVISIGSIDPAVLPIAEKIMGAVIQAGGRAFIAGGAVRDALLGGVAKDLDIEVYGLPGPKLEETIAKVTPFDTVGKSFGVYKLKKYPVDVALPRRESKTGSGHRGFEVVGDPNMSFEEACARRDFTINSILWDVAKSELIDPRGGQKDLKKRLLRHTSEHFSEDPLRVLRGMQFAARFELTIDPSTIELCSRIRPEGLPEERLFEEWKKLILKGKRISLGLNFLKDCGWIKYYPELEAMIGCQQEPEWHPEGDVWAHTLHCMDAFAKGRDDPSAESALSGSDQAWEDLVVGFAVLLHDIGKPATTQFIDGRWRSRGHDSLGVPIAERFLRRLTNEAALFDEVLPLVECHMRPLELYNAKAGDSAIRRLACKVKRIDRLIRVAQADMMGRPPMPAKFPEGPWLLEKAKALAIEDSAPKPVIQGRDLIALGYKPGPAFKKVLEAAYDAQLEGVFKDTEGGGEWLKEFLKINTK